MSNNFATAGNMEEILRQESQDFTVNGKCSGCGACCPDCLHISDNEIKRIREYINSHDIKPCRHVPILQTPGTTVDLLCPFVDTGKENKKCIIYEVRPEICREYICSESKWQMVKRISEKENGEIMSVISHNEKHVPPINIGQTFYPDIYMPKVGDKVILNGRYRNISVLFRTTTFKVMDKPDKENKVHICAVCNNAIKFHYDIAGLTKII